MSFVDGKKNEIALLGQLKGDAEAPRNAVIDYQPCDECLANWSQGVALIRVTDKPIKNDMPPLTEKDGIKLYPTAQYHVIIPEAAKRLFNIDVPAGTPILMEAEAFDKFTNDAKQSGALDDNGEVAK